MAIRVFCDTCDFRFTAGHSHYTRATDCLCPACGERFAAVAESSFGPRPGEKLPVCRRQYHRPRRRLKYNYEPTGLAIVVPNSLRDENRLDDLIDVTELIENLNCPDCENARLTARLYAAASCPNCKTGTLVTRPIEIKP